MVNFPKGSHLKGINKLESKFKKQTNMFCKTKPKKKMLSGGDQQPNQRHAFLKVMVMKRHLFTDIGLTGMCDLTA